MLTQVTLPANMPEARFNVIADAANDDVVIVSESGDITAKTVNRAGTVMYYELPDGTGTWNGIDVKDVDSVVMSLGIDNSDMTVSELESVLREHNLQLRVKSEADGMRVTVSRNFAPLASKLAATGELASTILNLVEKTLEGNDE